MKPFVKWAGGKTQLLEEIKLRFPQSFNTYFEPFLGGGAVLLNTQPDKAIVNDINVKLVKVYIQIRDNVDDLIKLLQSFDSSVVTQELYNSRRSLYNSSSCTDLERVGLFIWLNKNCFNGLYRENSKGQFNVPWNQRTHGSCFDEDNLRQISKYLNTHDVEFYCASFEQVCALCQRGDFVYFDSPYIPVSDTANFTSYVKDGFGYEDHRKLYDLWCELTRRGVYCMLSNNDVFLVRDWYKDYNISSVNVSRSINSKGNGRRGQEVIITNY